ncbi:MAG: EcsC family protein [Bacteroidota bacterium]
MQMTPDHIEQLRVAKQILENPSLTAKLTSVIGRPIERGLELLPDKWSEVINNATTKSLEAALDVALMTFGKNGPVKPSNLWHKVAATAAGAGGGAWGIPALVIELPVSTTIMLRSIADIARSEGEEIRLPESKLACLEVFALGGRTSKDDAAESGYFAVRAALAKAVSEAAQFIAKGGLAKEGGPAIVRLISLIAARFGVTVSEKAAAQAVPVVGALGGALINLAFIDHFQDMARGHFTVRRLERAYGNEVVEHEYRKLNQ